MHEPFAAGVAAAMSAANGRHLYEPQRLKWFEVALELIMVAPVG
jgi:hypothetical protein